MYVCVHLLVCFTGRSWAGFEGWSASDPWDWNAFPFVALQFLTGLPQHMSMMGLFLLSSFPEPPPPPPLHTTLFCLFPKRLAFLGATSEAALEGRPAGSWVASCAQAPGGGDNVLLIDWVSWAECRNLLEGEKEKWGWAKRDGGAGHSHRRRRSSDLCHRFISVWFTLLLGRWEMWWCEAFVIGQKFLLERFKSIALQNLNLFHSRDPGTEINRI